MATLPDIIHSKDEYILDYLDKTTLNKKYVPEKEDNKELEIPALTEKNSRFIEAVVRLDSNYAKESKATPPYDESYNPEKDANPNQDGKTYTYNKYTGSAIYWFGKMEQAQNDDDYKKALLGVIIAIDKSNSTHLEASGTNEGGGRLLIRNIIFGECPSIDKLKSELEKDFKDNPGEHLIAKISHPLKARGKKKNERYNLSFATKFCAYAAKYFKTNNQYSKYDNVVATALPYYTNLILGATENKNKYKISDNDNSDKLSVRLTTYFDYCKSIDEIIETIKNNGGYQDLDKEKLDHIIWYAFKGK